MADAAALRMPRPTTPAGLRRALALAVSRGGAIAAQMGVQVAVGAVSGAAGIGLLQVHMAWTNLAAEFVGGGEATRALRETSVRGRNGSARRNLQHSARRIAVSGAALGLVVCVVLLLLRAGDLSFGGNGTALALAILISAPLLAVGRLCAEALKALADPLAAVTLENLVLPAVLLGLCALMALGALPASAAALLTGATAGLLLGLVLLGLRLRSRLQDGTPADVTGEAAPLPRFEQCFFWLNGLLNIAFLQLPFLLLPLFVGADDIGRFAVAHKLVNVITTLLILLAGVYGPRFARAAGDGAELRRLLGETQRLSLALFLPVWLGLLAGAAPLAALFSLPAGSLGGLLLALGLGQLANAATGLSGVLLSMSGGARQELRSLMVSLLAALLLIAVAGADVEHLALAVTAAIALRNLLSFLAARRHCARIDGARS